MSIGISTKCPSGLNIALNTRRHGMVLCIKLKVETGEGTREHEKEN